MMRILHLPTTVGGGPSGLSYQLKLLGFDSEVWSIEQNYLGYPVDRVLTDSHDPLIVQMLKVLKAGTYVFGKWDVVHFNYGSTLFSNGGKLLAMRPQFLPGRKSREFITWILSGIAKFMQRLELNILKYRRIPIFVSYQGDDARQGDYSLEHYEFSIASQVHSGYYSPESDKWKRNQIALIAKYASKIYAVNPDLMNVLPDNAEFTAYGHVPINDLHPDLRQGEQRKLRFAHAPSNREVKGTRLILSAFSDLRAEGYEFDLDLVEGIRNDEAFARIRESDVVVDQLNAGWYGGVAVESMALGKPVVAYIREADLKFLPQRMRDDLPIFRTTPLTIKESLRGILEMPRFELLAVAKRSRAFVENWHDPLAIAKKVANDYLRAKESMDRKGNYQ